MEDLASVIIPVYNVEVYLDRCIKSVVNQTYQNLEIILVDDGSPDSCPHKCDEWAQKDKRIRVIHKKNEGLGFARNSGLDIATGDYIMFVVSDDYISPDAVSIMHNRMEMDQSDLVVGQFVKVYEDGFRSPSAFPWINNRVVTKEAVIGKIGSCQDLPVYAWGKLYRRHIFNTIRYRSLTCGEDVYILPDIIDQCKTISLDDSLVYFYYQRDTSIVHTKKLVQMVDSMVASLRMSRYLFERDHLKGASRYYYSDVCQFFPSKSDVNARRLLKNSFSIEEKRMLRKNRDGKTIMALIVARFPSVYKLYCTYIKKAKLQ